MSETLKEACGVFGIYLPDGDAARTTFYGLYALQHRGQESAGIATSDGRQLHVKTGMGLVSQVFDENDLAHLPGFWAIGHTRYATTGGSRYHNSQPLCIALPKLEQPVALEVEADGDNLCLAHNGNLSNSQVLREDLASQGHLFKTDTDSEAIAILLTQASGSWENRFYQVMRRLVGSYCLTILLRNKIFAIRDPLGNRPLCLGRVGEGWAVASETCALEHIDATDIREIEPGEVVQIDAKGVTSFFPLGRSRRTALCSFEFIYFARPDSIIADRVVYQARVELGRQLAREHPVEADLVMGVPDSATAAAIGYAHESGIPFSEGLVKNRYVGRTFIQPSQHLRDLGVKLKFNSLARVLAGKRVVVVDDSIVRGTTTPRVVNLLRQAKAAEVHMRITSPPLVSPCFYGVDMATQDELISSQQTVAAICRHIGADTLGFLSQEGLERAIGLGDNRACFACFTRRYPTPVQPQLTFNGLARATMPLPLVR